MEETDTIEPGRCLSLSSAATAWLMKNAVSRLWANRSRQSSRLTRVDGIQVSGAAPPANDATLRDHVVAELGRQEWGEDGRVQVSCTDGTVHLQGIVFDMRERDAMRVAAENVPGVKKVTDQLDYLDPNIGVIGIA